MPENDNPNNMPDAGTSDSFMDIFNEGVEETIGQQEGNVTPGSPESDDGSGNQSAADKETGAQPAATPSTETPEVTDKPEALEGEEDELEDPDSPKNDPKRVEYWQSRADKTEAELGKYKTQVESQLPLVKYINENPALAKDVYSTIQTHLDGSPEKGSSAKSTSNTVETPERPQKPQKPANYDPVDAINARDSESFTYRTEVEQYQEDLTEYNEALVNSQSQRQEQEQTARKQQTQQQEKAKQLYNEAIYRYQMKPEDAGKFVQWAYSPDYSVEDLVSVFNHQKNMQGKKQKSQGTNANAQKPPVPPAQNGNQMKREVTEVDVDDPEEMGSAFTDSLFDFTGQG